MSEDVGCSFPRGSIFYDSKNNKWITKSFIGVEGSREVYAVIKENDETSTDHPVFIKVEQEENESLSNDFQFYIDNANPVDIEDWIKLKNIQNFGLNIPPLLGSGSHKQNGQSYHFIVTEQSGKNLWTLFEENGKQFPAHTVYKVAIQVIRAIQYMHSRGFVHANIKGENLLLDSENKRAVYLINYDLASDYPAKNGKGYHYGTIEYSSRDNHIGVPTPRGDVEMVLYNMIRWLGHSLPWDNHLNDPSKVQQLKEEAFKNITIFLRKCFKLSEIPAPISEFALAVSSMYGSDEPAYKQLRYILNKGLKKLYHVSIGRLNWKVDIVVQDRDTKSPKQNLKHERCQIDGLKSISANTLAIIISENCRDMSEVDLESTNIGSLLDIIHRLIPSFQKTDEQKVNTLQWAWKNNVAKLRTKVLGLWRLKGIIFDQTLIEEDKDKDENQKVSTTDVSLPLLTPFNSQNTLPSKASGTSRRPLPRETLIKSPNKQQVATSAKSAKRNVKGSKSEKTRSKKRKTSFTKIDGSDEYDETDEDDDNLVRRSSPSPNSHHNNSYMTRSMNSSTHSPYTSRFSRDFSPVSRCSSSGFSSRPSMQGDDFHVEGSLYSKTYVFSQDQWLDRCKWLNNWLDLKDQNLEALGVTSTEPQTIDSKVQRLRILRGEFSAQQPQLDCWQRVRSEMPENSAQELDGIVRRWKDQLARLENHGQKLIDTHLDQLHDTLEVISVKLNELTFDKSSREQLLCKMKNLADQLESQRELLTDLKTTSDELCKIFNSSALSSKFRAKLQNIEELCRNLQQKIEFEKLDFEKSFSNRYQFDDSCKEIHLWLDDRLADMLEKMLVSTDSLTQQLEQHKTFHRHVMKRETEVMDLLKRGREDLVRCQNAESRTIQQRYLDSMQAKCDRLKKRSLETLNKLQTCFNLGEDYHQGEIQFSTWLKKVENKLDSVKLILSDQEGDFKKKFEEISVLKSEVHKKSDEFKRIKSLGDTFVDSCDVDKDDLLKNKLRAMQNRWDKLNSDLSERTQFLDKTSEEFDSLDKRLRDIENKLLQCENKTTSTGVFGVAAHAEELKQDTKSLRKSLCVVHQDVEKLILKSREQGIDVSQLRNDVERVLGSIDNFECKSLTQKFTIKMEKQNETETTQYQNIPKHMQIDQKPKVVVIPSNNDQRIEEIDLVSSDEDESDLGIANKGMSTPQHFESPLEQKDTTEQSNLNIAVAEVPIKQEPLDPEENAY